MSELSGMYELRKEYETYMEEDFYAGMASIEEDWNPSKQTYDNYAHHVGWCVWRKLSLKGTGNV